MQTQTHVVARKPAPKKNVPKQPKKPAVQRGSKRTEEFIAAVMGLKFR